MANTYDAEMDDMGGGGPSPGPGGPGQPGPASNVVPFQPRGNRNSPMLAALIRSQQSAQPSAPGPGNAAGSLTKLSGSISMLQEALNGFQPGTPPHKDVLKAIQILSKHMVQGSPAAGVQKTMFSDMLQGTVRNAMLQKLASQGQGQPGQQAQAPATPMPGA